jgi:hypothetical protein
MIRKTLIVCVTALLLGVFLLAAVPLGAQSGEKYKARLAPAPPLGLRATGRTPASFVAGIGTADATLSGRKLAITGSFEKMASAATAAKVGLGLAPGARLDLILDLTLTKSQEATPPGTSGSIAGTFDLTPAQVEALKQGKFYIQINSEGAPNGHLLGWLLK